MISVAFIVLFALLIDSSSALFTLRATAPWIPRQRHASWSDGASIFIAGGQTTGGSTLNDVRTSADGGATWNGLFGAGYAMGLAGASFQGRQYILGGRSMTGCSDSSYFTSWTPSAGSSASLAPWSARAYAMAVVWTPPPATNLPSQLLLIGGARCSQPFLNDVWSYNSTTWTLLGLGAFPPVASAGIATILKGSQIVLAGGVYSNASYSSVYNTVWVGAYSGVTSQLAWTLRCTAAPWSARAVSLAATSNDYLYMIEGAPIVNLALPGSNDVRHYVLAPRTETH